MSLDDLLATARNTLPLLRNTTSPLSPYTTPTVDIVPTPTYTGQREGTYNDSGVNPNAILDPTQVEDRRMNRPGEVTDELMKAGASGLDGNPYWGPDIHNFMNKVGPILSNPTMTASIPLMQAAIGPLLNGGKGGTGSAAGDINRGVNIVAHGISNGGTVIPSGGPTSNIDYASLPGLYGKLVDPPGGPSDLRLQKGAWQSLHSLGVPASAILGGSYRTYAQQAANYAKDSHRFAPPGTSLHEYGLAIDMNSAYINKYANVLLANGWYRERSDEPWHFSYGVFTPAPQATTSRSQPSKPPQRTQRPTQRQQRGSSPQQR